MSSEPIITGTQILPTLNHIKAIKNKTIEIKGGYDVTISKPDVHINPSLLKQKGNMISIKSTSRLANTPYKPNFISLNSQLQFDFSNMTNICRPERDNSLKTPLLKTIQKLRKYKIGTSPDYKIFLLKEDLNKALDNDTYEGNIYNKHILNAFSNNDNIIQENSLDALEITNHLTKQDATLTNDDMSFYDDEISIGSREKTNTTIIKDKKNKKSIDHTKKLKENKKLVINPELAYVNTDLYRMDSPLNISLTSDDLPLYSPATFRLPKTEQVIGFGVSNPIIDEKLSAYRVHANAAIQAAAALEDASVVESILSGGKGPFDSNAGDTYHESRKESFLMQNSRMNDSSNNDILPIDASQQSEYIALNDLPADINENRHMAVSSPSKKGRLHCCKCFRSASLWCRKCVSAYCGICWGQVLHHDLTQMMYDIETSTKLEALDNNNKLTKSIIPDQVLTKNNSYSKSIMFLNDNPFIDKEQKRNNIGNNAPAMIPLPSHVITKYEEYPQPPVYITGKGSVRRHINSPMRPYTSPITTQIELHQLQMNNHFARKSQLEYKREINSKYCNEYIHSNMQIKNGLRYEQDGLLKNNNDLKHSKGHVIIKKSNQIHSSVRINTPSFSIGSNNNGVLDFAYSSKPSSRSKPLLGIANNITLTTDWKKDLFANNIDK